jgi:nucleoid-associated protein YgaU
MKCKYLLIILLFVIQAVSLSAAEGDPQHSEFVISLLNNQFLTENIRLIALAEENFTEGRFDEAVNYAREAIRFAGLSDEFISLQLRIKQANDAIAEAQSTLDRAERIGAARRYADELNEAKTAFAEALEYRSQEEWDNAMESAKRVMEILAILPERPILAAQYLVRTWVLTRDCLWNIAAMPEIYDDPTMWPHIWEANRHILRQPNNPNLIHPGMLLTIPSIRGETRFGILEQ